MESAIPTHLQCPRTRHRRVGDDYTPPYPSFVARHAPAVTRVVMAYFGVQVQGTSVAPAAGALSELAASFDAVDGPGHWDRARYVDDAGFSNVICAAYWDEPARFERWFTASGQRWTREPRPGLGTFIEVVKPGVDRYETLFSAPDRAEGIATLARGMSDTVIDLALAVRFQRLRLALCACLA